MNQQMSAEMKLALGRIFRLASRPAQEGDVAEYERCRALILNAADAAGINTSPDYQHCWARDRLKGAAGQ
jgi:hypothetical protein